MKNVIFSLVVLFLSSMPMDICAQMGNQDRKEPKSKKGYEVGDKASDFKLQNVDGEFYSLSDIKDAKGFIVVFTSNECPFAVMYQDRLIDLHERMAPKGYPVVAINANDETMEAGDSFEHMKERAKDKSFPFLYLKDKDQDVFPQYGATKTPHVFLLDKNLTVQYIGAIDDNAKSPEDVEIRYVENAIDALESGVFPDPNYTKAVGCPIKSNKMARGKGKKGGRRGPPSPDMIMEKMDSDGDGKISVAEAHGPLKNDFKDLDENDDGFLTAAELSNIKKRRK